MGGFQAKVKSARLLVSGKPLAFEQNELGLRLTGLLQTPPDQPVTVIAVDCDREPVIDHLEVRKERPRYKVGVSWDS
jgi:alpha-L-fucosidase